MSETTGTTQMTETQAAAIAEGNKAAFAKSNKVVDYSNSAIKACVGSCQVNNDTSSSKAVAVNELAAIHNNMTEKYLALKKDTTLTEDHVLLLQDNLVSESTQEFASVMSRIKGELETDKNRMQKELYTSSLQIDTVTLSLLPVLMPDLIKSPYELMNLEMNAAAIAVLNARGLYPNAVNQKRGEPRQDITDAINSRYSPEPYHRLKNIAEDMKMIADAEKQEYNITKRMRPDQKKISKIRANKVRL